MRLDHIVVGDDLAPLELPLTTSFIVATALASRDFQDVHHDPVLARERGAQDIFMNIITTNGLVGRYVTAWAGPDARITKIALRLGTPNYPGDTMTLTGQVTKVDNENIEVAVRGINSLGDHVIGTVHIVMPAAST